jgi:hypothetical protein
LTTICTAADVLAILGRERLLALSAQTGQPCGIVVRTIVRAVCDESIRRRYLSSAVRNWKSIGMLRLAEMLYDYGFDE